MTRVLLILPFLALSLFAAPEPVVVGAHFAIQNKKDPVSGKAVKEKLFLDWKGLRIHFAEWGNLEKFRKAPKKYVGALGFALVEKKDKSTVVDLQNKKCPVMSKDDAVAKRFIEYGEVRVRACCPKCLRRMKGQAKLVAKVLGYGWVPPVIDLRNTKCPITGDDCYPEAPIWQDIDGIRVRVCCDNCAKKALKDKERTFRMLQIDPKKLKEKHFGTGKKAETPAK